MTSSNYRFKPQWWQIILSAAVIFLLPLGLASYVI